jgi:hypothetical protein
MSHPTRRQRSGRAQLRLVSALAAAGLATGGLTLAAPAAHAAPTLGLGEAVPGLADPKLRRSGRTILLAAEALNVTAADSRRACGLVAPVVGRDGWAFGAGRKARLGEVRVTLRAPDGRTFTARTAGNGSTATLRTSPAGATLIAAEAKAKGRRGELRLLGACPAKVRPVKPPAAQPPPPAPVDPGEPDNGAGQPGGGQPGGGQPGGGQPGGGQAGPVGGGGQPAGGGAVQGGGNPGAAAPGGAVQDGEAAPAAPAPVASPAPSPEPVPDAEQNAADPVPSASAEAPTGNESADEPGDGEAVALADPPRQDGGGSGGSVNWILISLIAAGCVLAALGLAAAYVIRSRSEDAGAAGDDTTLLDLGQA